MATLLELFRTLSSFSPQRRDLADAPWEQYTDWAIAQGLAPLAAYNLEYRLGDCGAPEWAKDRLLSIYQGSANDNVMKLVNFKRAVDDLEGRRVVLVGGGSFVESLYPHVAFRPVVDLCLFLAAADLDGFTNFMRGAQFKPDPGDSPGGPARVLTDTRTLLTLYTQLAPTPALDEALRSRALPMKVFGPSLFRLSLEDSLLVEVALLVRGGFEVPYLTFVDLRELVLGAPSLGGVYSRPVEAATVRARWAEWKLERGAWAALTLMARLFPEAEAAVQPLLPELDFVTRQVLERGVVAPLAEVGRTRELKGADALRALLTSG